MTTRNGSAKTTKKDPEPEKEQEKEGEIERLAFSIWVGAQGPTFRAPEPYRDPDLVALVPFPDLPRPHVDLAEDRAYFVAGGKQIRMHAIGVILGARLGLLGLAILFDRIPQVAPPPAIPSRDRAEVQGRSLEPFTHAELVRRAVRWLLGPGGCKVALAEPSPWGSEEFPDAIGWPGGGHSSTVIEAKVSRADFFADRKKGHRNIGMGRRRYYFTPSRLLLPSELPSGWGLLECDRLSGGVHLAAPAAAREPAHYRQADELGVTLGELRKVQILMGGGDLIPTDRNRELLACFGRGFALGTIAGGTHILK